MAKLKKNLGLLVSVIFVVGVLPLWTKPAVAANLVENGDFESPNVGFGTFGTFPSIPGWNLAPSSLGSGIEIQNNVAGSPYSGQQFVELSSDNVTGIEQNISTVTGDTYQLQFAFSPRPGVNQENITDVSWGGNQIATVEGNGASLSNTQWTVYDYTLKATSDITTLEFDDLREVQNSLGSYIDDVSVTQVPESTPILGILTLGAIGVASRFKSRKNQNSWLK
jgi:hypothetical protein